MSVHLFICYALDYSKVNNNIHNHAICTALPYSYIYHFKSNILRWLTFLREPNHGENISKSKNIFFIKKVQILFYMIAVWESDIPGISFDFSIKPN